jgi:hypothetical protein
MDGGPLGGWTAPPPGRTLRAMAQATLSLLTAFALLLAPAVARAQAAPAAPSLLAAGVDDLGRPFPDPVILQRARVQAGLGIGMTVAGGALLFGGMMVGSAAARGELVLPPSPFPRLIHSDRIDDSSIDGFLFIGVTAGLGVVLAFVGVPLMSVGVFTTKQLLRTIKGAEKVPRTVANEPLYWRGLMTQHLGQATSIAGGALIAVGIIALVGQGATVDTQIYDPLGWIIGPSILAGGVGVLVLGMETAKKGRATQDATWDAVDPRRQPVSVRPVPSIPLPVIATRAGPTGPETWAGVGWSLSF